MCRDLAEYKFITKGPPKEVVTIQAEEDQAEEEDILNELNAIFPKAK
jgi:hypothetical protein